MQNCSRSAIYCNCASVLFPKRVNRPNRVIEMNQFLIDLRVNYCETKTASWPPKDPYLRPKVVLKRHEIEHVSTIRNSIGYSVTSINWPKEMQKKKINNFMFWSFRLVFSSPRLYSSLVHSSSIDYWSDLHRNAIRWSILSIIFIHFICLQLISSASDCRRQKKYVIVLTIFAHFHSTGSLSISTWSHFDLINIFFGSFFSRSICHDSQFGVI